MTPEQQYAQRLAEREASLALLTRSDARIGGVRLMIGASFLIAAYFCFGAYHAPAAWLLVPLIAFVATVLWHSRVRSRRARILRAVAFYRDGLDRIADQWYGKGPGGERFDAAHHIYAGDLDLFGAGSLYQLLCAARTPMGEESLARWLLAPAGHAAILERQAAIADLRGRLDLREALAVEGTAPRIDLPVAQLLAWSGTDDRLDRSWMRTSALLLPALGLASVAILGVWGLLSPLLCVLAVESAVMYLLRTRIEAALRGVEGAYESLKALSQLLARIEAEPFEAAPLRALVGQLSSHGASASAILAKLATVANFVEARRNPLLGPLLLFLMYPLLTALGAERWRRAHGHAVQAWLEIIGNFEALLSLSRYSVEHPDHPFAEFADGRASFEARGLGHPLLARTKRVSNDVSLTGAARIWLVSGSNMSGKSTLLRSVGINTVLAMAGAPVCAERLRLTPLQVGASIRVNDSLHEGSSRFYAEITRLRQLFEPFELPMLFLMDELLQGTNSADRRIGAQGVIRALIERGAIGLLSTHDLALTDIVDSAEGTLVNVHFQDEISGNELRFDFKLRPGIVTKSNGIELMRSIGLKV